MSSRRPLDVVTTVRGGAIWWTRTKAKGRHGVVCRLNCVIHVWAPWGRDACNPRRYINPRTLPLPLLFPPVRKSRSELRRSSAVEDQKGGYQNCSVSQLYRMIRGGTTKNQLPSHVPLSFPLHFPSRHEAAARRSGWVVSKHNWYIFSPKNAYTGYHT